MPLKRISLPEKINFPARITEVHVKAGQLVDKGDPIYTLEASNGKRGILRAPCSGEISEGPMAVDARFVAPTHVIGILTPAAEEYGTSEGDTVQDAAAEASASYHSAADTVRQASVDDAAEQSSHETADVKPADRAEQFPGANRSGFLSTSIGIAIFVVIGTLAAVLPGLLFGLLGLRSGADPQFLAYTAGLGLALIFITTLLAVAKAFGGRVILPVLGVLMVFASATFAGYASHDVRNAQAAAVEPVLELARNTIGSQFISAKKESVEIKQITRLPGDEKTNDIRADDYLIGEIRAFAFNFCPVGWVEASGALLPISSNTALFSLYGTYYGGDGRTTFGLPDLRGRQVRGPGKSSLSGQRDLGSRSGRGRVTLKNGDSKVRAGQSNLAVKYCVAAHGIFPSRS